MRVSPRSSRAPASTFNRTRSSKGSKLIPVRTCLGCRSRADRSALLRVVARNGEVIPDPSATLPGRGGWVHPTRDCIETAIKRKAFGRALTVSTGLSGTMLLDLLDTSNEMAD